MKRSGEHQEEHQEEHRKKHMEVQHFLEQIGAEDLEHSFWGWLGCELESIEEGRVTLTLKPEQKHLNVIDIVHGGVITSMMDTAMGIASMVAFPGEQMVTANLNMHFLAPLRKGSKVTTIGEVIHRSRKSVTTSGRTYNDACELCAAASATFRVVSIPAVSK